MNNCIECKCLTCEKIDTCGYHEACSFGHGHTQDYLTGDGWKNMATINVTNNNMAMFMLCEDIGKS